MLGGVNKPFSNVNIITHTCPPFSSQFEIDTIRLFIHWVFLTEYEYDFLISLVKAEKTNRGYKGRYNGFSILISDKGITITGSLSNYCKGHTDTLPHSELQEAAEKLGKELKLNLHNAKLYRVDINMNFLTANDASCYTNNLFIILSRFKRLEKDDGVLFKTNSKSIIFYNKSREIAEKGNSSKGSNWYRCEFRIMSGVKKETGMGLLKDLYEPRNYLKLLNIFRDYYLKIKKQTVSTQDLSKLKNVKEYKNLLMLKGIEQKGGEKEIFREIEQLDRKNVFDNRKQKSRLKTAITELTNSKELSQLHPLVMELDKKFEEAYLGEINKFKIDYYGKKKK